MKKAKRRIKDSLNRHFSNLAIEFDGRRAASIDIDSCKSVCLALGPYRNLTTMTAAGLFLHPHCQVLNHGGDGIFNSPRVNFLTNYSRKSLDHFIQYAIRLSARERRGERGGSITASHAFESKYATRGVFEGAGVKLIKADIRCLFWKESLKTSRLIQETGVDLGAILDQESRLRFLLPIRHPLDCARSNLKTGQMKKFRNLTGQSRIEDVLSAVLDEIQWFAGLQQKHPDRFFYYFEHSINREMLCDLADFLGLERDEEWLENALTVMSVKPRYEADPGLSEVYRGEVEKRFSGLPGLRDGLLAFVRR